MIGHDVASGIRRNTGHDLGLDVEGTALGALLLQQVQHLAPQFRGALGGPYQERFVPFVGRVVVLDEVADIHLAFPDASCEAFPCLLHCLTTLLAVRARDDGAPAQGELDLAAMDAGVQIPSQGIACIQRKCA